MSNIDIPLKQKQKDLEKADEYYTTPEYKTGLGEDINKIESEDLKYVDYLSITDPEEYVENNLNLEDYIFADSKVVEDLIKNKQKDALKKIGLDQGNKTRKNYATEIQDSDNSFTTEDIIEMVDSTELSDVKRFGVNRLRLDEDQEKEYKEDILELSALKENKNKTPEEKLLQFSLSKKVAKLRENQDKQFINPETGQIDGAVKKEVTEKAKLYSKNLKTKTDYRKFLDRYKEEYHNIKGIEEEMKILTKSETPPSRYIIENYAYANLREAVSEDRPGFQPKIGDKSVAVEKLKNKLLFLYDGLAKSEKNFMALNRALLLNEDPAAVSRGFKMLEGIPLLQGAGEILTSAGESLAETVTGEDIVTDKDYANTIVQLANETGVKLTEEQYDRGKEDFEEKLGGAVGTSVPMMAEIAFNVLVTKNIGAALKIPSYLSKLKKLKDSPKIASFVGKAMEATTQAIAFEFAEGGSLAMGAGEYYGGRLGEKIVSAITKGKGGKFLALFGKVVGAGTAGTVEEYAGEFIDEGFKQGFFTKEQFETTFGRTYDEALDKFLITAVMATAMGGAAEVGNVLYDAKSYYKNLGDTKRLTELEKLIEANKEPSESTGEGKNLELKVNKEESIGEEELVPFSEEVDKDGKTFLTTEGETTEGETKTEESIEEEITEPTQEQIQEDIANNDFATFKYEDESSVPKELKEYISSKGSTQVGRGSSKKKSVNVTVPKSLANYLNSKAEASTEQSSETTTDTTTETRESRAEKKREVRKKAAAETLANNSKQREDNRLKIERLEKERGAALKKYNDVASTKEPARKVKDSDLDKTEIIKREKERDDIKDNIKSLEKKQRIAKNTLQDRKARKIGTDIETAKYELGNAEKRIQAAKYNAKSKAEDVAIKERDESIDKKLAEAKEELEKAEEAEREAKGEIYLIEGDVITGEKDRFVTSEQMINNLNEKKFKSEKAVQELEDKKAQKIADQKQYKVTDPKEIENYDRLIAEAKDQVKIAEQNIDKFIDNINAEASSGKQINKEGYVVQDLKTSEELNLDDEPFYHGTTFELSEINPEFRQTNRESMGLKNSGSARYGYGIYASNKLGFDPDNIIRSASGGITITVQGENAIKWAKQSSPELKGRIYNMKLKPGARIALESGGVILNKEGNAIKYDIRNITEKAFKELTEAGVDAIYSSGETVILNKDAVENIEEIYNTVDGNLTKVKKDTTTDTTTEPKTELEVKKESISSELNELQELKKELESKPVSDRTLQDKIILDSIKKKGLTSAQAKSLIKNYKTSKKSIKKDIRDQTGQTDTSDKITITQKKLAKELYKAEEKALKNLKVSQKKLISNLFKKLSELAGIRKGKEKSTLKGKVSFSNVKKILQELNKLDPSNDNDVLALEHKIDQLVKDSEFEVKKQEAIKLQEKLQKIGKKRKGVRGKYAAELNDIDLNKVESIDAFLETAKSLLGSFKGAIKKDNEITITETDPGIVTQLEETIKTLKEEQAKYEELLGERREIKRLENLEEEYELSGLSDVMTLEEYQQFRESSPEEAVKAIPEKGKKEKALRRAVSERIDNLKGWLKDNEKTLTQGQKRKINDIINNKELINDDSTNMTDVVDTFNALEEILSFDSTAGITRITSKLEGIQLGKKIKKYFLGKFKDWGSIGIDFKTMNQSTYLKAISNSLDTAKELSAVLLVNIKKAKVKAKKISDSFNIKVDKVADKLKIKQEQSVKIGVFSRLKQHTEGLTQEEIDEDFALKLESIKNEIIELKKQNKKTSEVKSNKRKSKVLEEVYSKIKDAKSYSEIESNLSENESKMLAFLEESFAKIRPDLENTYLENQGKDMEGVSNYIPTVVSNKRDGSTQTGDLKDNVSRESLDRETSGRTIKRSKTDPTGKTQYNYDIVEVAKFGMKQSLFDINVLYDSQVLANTLSSKDFKEAIDNSKILKDLKEKLANTYSPNDFAIDRTEQDKITREIIDYFKAFVVMPLKTVWQYAKQPISIMGATLTRVNLKATGRSYNIISKSIVSKEYRQRLDKFLENSTVSIRTVEGDADIASSDPLYVKLLNKFPKKLAGKPTAFTKKYISDALSLSDYVAAKGSFLSFYINERLKKDPNYVFDLDKEIANPDMKAVGKADVEADWVNNNSDVDESGTFLKGNTTIKNLLFLFKSFAVNQSINTILDARNILSSQRTGKVEASRALSGTILGAFAFEGMRQVIKLGSEKMLSSLLDDMEDEEKKEVSEEIGSILAKSMYTALLDVVAGGAPSDLTYYLKVGINYANWMLFYEDENEERKEMGEELIKKRDKDPFFIDNKPSGIVGLAESYITAGYKSVDVLTDEYSNEEMDRVATINLIMMILQDENLRKPTSKAVKKYKKINEAEKKLYE